jgi:hypothetical protein
MTTTTAFDFTLMRRAIEERDALTQVGFFAPQAEVHIVDRDHPPRAPRVVRGTTEIRDWISEVCSRDMTHQVTSEVLGTDRIAYLTECRYPDGTQVLCSASASVADGLIIRLTGLQVWDD